MGKKIPEYNDEQVAAALLSGGRPYAKELTHALELPLSMLDVPVLTLRQVAELTTSAIHQKGSDAWKRCFEKHKKWLDSDIMNGTINPLDPDTYMPFGPGDMLALSDEEFHSALITIDDFGKFARSLGIYVTIEAPAQQMDSDDVQGSNSQDLESQPGKDAGEFNVALENLLKQIEGRAENKGIPFDRNAMPGRKVDFHELANKYDSDLKSDHGPYTPRTFSDYIKGYCKFKKGAREDDFYRKLFPELKWD